jgi:ATP synthase protein I
MLRGALLPTAVVSVPVVLACWWWQGGPGLVGAMRRTARLEPMMVMAVALLTYLTKIGLLGLFLVLTGNAEWLSGECFAIAVVAAALIWLPLEMRAYARARLSVYDEPHTTPGEPKSPVSVAE